uniref:Uncharacterized protein n=1 Tax=Anopheles dirus TaxID=7168 RepID=A0A182N4E3_9DIPT
MPAERRRFHPNTIKRSCSSGLSVIVIKWLLCRYQVVCPND